MVIDTTKSQKGGRESVILFDPLISEDPEMSAQEQFQRHHSHAGSHCWEIISPPSFPASVRCND
jgi:hypothetical protein